MYVRTCVPTNMQREWGFVVWCGLPRDMRKTQSQASFICFWSACRCHRAEIASDPCRLRVEIGRDLWGVRRQTSQVTTGNWRVKIKFQIPGPEVDFGLWTGLGSGVLTRISSFILTQDVTRTAWTSNHTTQDVESISPSISYFMQHSNRITLPPHSCSSLSLSLSWIMVPQRERKKHMKRWNAISNSDRSQYHG